MSQSIVVVLFVDGVKEYKTVSITVGMEGFQLMKLSDLLK